MHFTTYLGAAVSALAGLASANELAVRGKSEPCSFDVGKEWSDAVLFKGLASVATEGSAAVDLGVGLPKASLSGSIDISVADEFLVAPTVRVDLGGLAAYLEIDLTASASIFDTFELIASEKLSIVVPGLAEVDIGAALALDLVLGISAAVDVSAGFQIIFPEGSYVEISVLTLEVVDKCLDNLGISSVPIAVGAEVDLAAAVTIDVGLRLRAELGLSAEIDIVGLEIGAGADFAVWFSLCDVTTVIVSTSECPVAVSESFALSLGVAIDLNVDVNSCFDLSLAPSVIVTLAKHEAAAICLPGQTKGSGSGSGSSSGSGSGSSSGSGSGSGNHQGEGSSSSGSSSSGSSGSGSSGAGSNSTGSSSTSAASSSTTSLSSPEGSSGDVTSTVTTTAVYTITSCYASVPNCPASHTQVIVTSTVDVYTTVCPATMTSSSSPQSSSSSSCSTPTPTGTLSPCATPSTSTFTPPASCPTPAPTVTITETYSTTECPETKTSASTAGPTSSAQASSSLSSVSVTVTTTVSVSSSASPKTSTIAPCPECSMSVQPGGPVSSLTTVTTTAGPIGTAPGTASYKPTTTGYPVTAGAAGVKVGAAVAVVLPAVVAALL